MTAKKDLTPPQIQALVEYAAEGRSKSFAARELGVPISRLNVWADRTGFRAELDAMFPAQRGKLVMTDALFCQFVQQSRHHGIRQACANLGTTPASAKIAAHEAGCLAEFCDLFPNLRKRTVEADDVAVPRDLDPAVKWLTKEWRVAA